MTLQSRLHLAVELIVFHFELQNLSVKRLGLIPLCLQLLAQPISFLLDVLALGLLLGRLLIMLFNQLLLLLDFFFHPVNSSLQFFGDNAEVVVLLTFDNCFLFKLLYSRN